jgi:hypothetical protein
MTLRIGRSPSGTVFLGQQTANPFTAVVNTTMAGGTSLIALGVNEYSSVAHGYPSDYVAVRVEEILEYERTILELQRELLHYKRLLAKAAPAVDAVEEYPMPVVPLDVASTRLINSILSAQVPPSATFTDFEEGEL